MTAIDFKHCKDCEQFLPVDREHFGQYKNIRNGVAGFGFRNSCRKCMAAVTAQHHAANPEKRAADAAKRSDQLNAAGGGYTGEDIQRIAIALAGMCRFCGGNFGPKPHIEHLTPVSRGGSSNPRNLSLACSSCNLAKTNKTLNEFEIWRAERGLPNRKVRVPNESPDQPLGEPGRKT